MPGLSCNGLTYIWEERPPRVIPTRRHEASSTQREKNERGVEKRTHEESNAQQRDGESERKKEKRRERERQKTARGGARELELAWGAVPVPLRHMIHRLL
jgi:hypothetical protein